MTVREVPADASCREQPDMREDAYLRLAADFDNYRKRVERDREADRERLASRLAAAVIPLHDATAMAETHARGKEARSAASALRRQCEEALAGIGAHSFGVPGEPFDPAVHQAVAIGEGEPGTVAEVLRQGWRCGSQVVRSAEVTAVPES